MTPSTLTAQPKTESRQSSEDRRKCESDRAFEEGVRWFLAVSRRAVCPAA